MESNITLTEADILSEVVAPDDPSLNQEFARAVLAVRLTDAASGRIRDLLQKKTLELLRPRRRRTLRNTCGSGSFLT
jgi:hypothetical protein